jgi:hypothetical protein
MGTAFVHTVLDDHSRAAYAEIHDDETAATAIGVLRRVGTWFAARGVTVERVLSDNGSAYRSHAWRDACLQLGIKPKRTRPYGPRPTARSNAFTAPWPTGGPSSGCSAANSPAVRPCPAGYTSTTITGPTPRSAAAHRSAAWPTSLGQYNEVDVRCALGGPLWQSASA